MNISPSHHHSGGDNFPFFDIKSQDLPAFTHALIRSRLAEPYRISRKVPQCCGRSRCSPIVTCLWEPFEHSIPASSQSCQIFSALSAALVPPCGAGEIFFFVFLFFRAFVIVFKQPLSPSSSTPKTVEAGTVRLGSCPSSTLKQPYLGQFLCQTEIKMMEIIAAILTT